MSDKSYPPFQPPQVERKRSVMITAKESHLIKVLREVNYGQITIHKISGNLTRVETVVSQKLEDKEMKLE